MIKLQNYKILQHELNKLIIKANVKKKDSIIIIKTDQKLENNNFNCRILNPVNKKLLDKFTPKHVKVKESAELYNSKIDNYINKLIKNGNTKWILNILYQTKQNSDIFYQDEKIILLRDIIWNGVDRKKLYMLAIPKNSKLRSIRDLQQKDLALLNHMKNKITDYLLKKWNLKENELYYFFHYHPSFYYLHLHVCVINHESLKSNFLRPKLLENVIENINNDNNYYQETSLYYELPITHKIYQLVFKD